jgi:hypothetical protein
MRQDQLEHAIRTACQIIGRHEVIVVGSQSILGTFREDQLPADATRSVEIDILQASGTAICVHDGQAILVTEHEHETWLPLSHSAEPAPTFAVHQGAGTAVTAAKGQILSSGTDGSVTLARRDANGTPAVTARADRRLRCTGARVENLKGDRELAIFNANGAE